MITHKRVYFVLASLLVVLLLTACAGKDTAAPTVKFMYWADSPKESADFDAWLKEYTQETTKPIEQLYAPYGEGYNQKLLILIGAKAAPDLFALTPELLQTFKGKQAIMPLDDYLQADGWEFPDRTQFPELYGEDGKLYALNLKSGMAYGIFVKAANPAESWELLKFLLKKAEAR